MGVAHRYVVFAFPANRVPLNRKPVMQYSRMLHRGNPPQRGRDMVARVQGREAAAAPGCVQA